MIYKFIDNNGSEITVNSLSSLQALVDSETVKKNTKVKAGLRGKWTTAESISDLVFEEKKEEHIPEEIIEPEEDIKTFLTKEENKKKSKRITTKKEEVEEIPDEQEEEEIKDIDEKEEEDTQEEHDEEKTDYDIEEKRDKTYDDENVIGLNFFESIGTCLKKYFVFKGRASRSEYWFFQLLFTVISIPALIFENTTDDTYIIFVGISGIIILLLLIPALAVTVRRFHDINKSGWFVLFQIIPFIGWIIILVMLIEKGTEGKNRFGDYPLKLKKNNK